MIGLTIAYIISDIDKALAFEWIAQEWNPEKGRLSFILLNSGESVLEHWLRGNKVPVSRVTYRGKKDLVRAIFAVKRILQKDKIQLVHCHLFDAALIGLLAARLAGIRKRIYTRHYATFHHQYFPRAVWYDRFINWNATDIVAISQNVKNTLVDLEGVAPAKIHVIHHGFKLNLFTRPDPARVAGLAAKYHVQGHFPVVGVISRYFELKGIQYIIPAFEELWKQYPNALLLLSNASGNYAPEIKSLLAQLPPECYREIIFEEDIASLYHLFNIFVHVPINAQIEAFGQTYIEALAAGIPSVFTLSGVATEFITDQRNAQVVPYKDADAIYAALRTVTEQPGLTEKMVQQGLQDVQPFNLDQMMHKLEVLYLSHH